MNIECEFCLNKFANLSSLKNHQKKAKYCLSIQNKTPDIINKCVCGKEFTRNDNYTRHINNCVNMYKNKLEESDKKINTIEINNLNQKIKEITEENTKIKELIIQTNKDDKKELIKSFTSTVKTLSNKSTKITNINNCNINNLLPLDSKYMKEQAKHLTLEYISQGPLGYAKFAHQFLLKDRVICTDVSRGNITFMNKDNKLIKDPKGSALLIEIADVMYEKSKDIYNSVIDEYELNDSLDEDAQEFIVKLQKFNKGLSQMRKGGDCEFSQKISKYLFAAIKSNKASTELK